MSAIDPATYEPTTPNLSIVKSRLSVGAWVARVEKALRESEVLQKIADRVNQGIELGAAIKMEVPPSRRSWVLRHWEDYRKCGWSALIDERLPREPKIASACGNLIESAREANPEIDVAGVLAILRGQKVKQLPSPSTIRTYFKRADRRMGRRKQAKKRAPTRVVEISCAGGELLLAAELETGAISTLCDGCRGFERGGPESVRRPRPRA